MCKNANTNYGSDAASVNANYADALKYLPERGILRETWERAGVRIELRDANQPDLFAGATEASIIFPYFNTEGNPLKNEFAIRCFPPGDGPKFLWPTGVPYRPYVLPTSLVHSKNSQVPVVIGEGPVRSLLFDQHGYCTIACNGCWGPFAKREDGKPVELHADLLSWKFRDKPVYFAADLGDIPSNDEVLCGLLRELIAFLSYGSIVKVLVWTPAGRKDGVDDYVPRLAGCDLAKQAAVIRDLIATAQDAVDFVRLRGGTEEVKGPHPWLDFFENQLYAVEMSDGKRKQIGKHFASALGMASIGTRPKQREWIPASGIQPATIQAVIKREGPPGYRNREGELTKLNQPFWARLYATEHIIVFDADETKFYRYESQSGLYVLVLKAKIKTEVSSRLFVAANEWDDEWTNLSRFRNADGISGVVEHLQGQVEQKDFFCVEGKKLVHLANCVLAFDQAGKFTVENFSPEHHSRNQSPIVYDPEATCPKFERDILGHLKEGDRILLQKYAGQCLLGRNITQRILIVDGVEGSSKSTFVLIIAGIVGAQNVHELRTQHLMDRFEIGRMLGSTLLYGPDVKGRFLSCQGASRLKSLVGGDPLDAELKNSNSLFRVKGQFNVITSSNTRQRIALEGDAGAWGRRLLIVRYDARYRGEKIPEYDTVLLRDESSGILNWALYGLTLLLKDIGQYGDIHQSEEQETRVGALLKESDSLRLFLSENIVRDDNADLTTDEIVSAYSEFCQQHGWGMDTARVVENNLTDLMRELFAAVKAHGIQRNGKDKRGFRKVTLLGRSGRSETTSSSFSGNGETNGTENERRQESGDLNLGRSQMTSKRFSGDEGSSESSSQMPIRISRIPSKSEKQPSQASQEPRNALGRHFYLSLPSQLPLALADLAQDGDVALDIETFDPTVTLTKKGKRKPPKASICLDRYQGKIRLLSLYRRGSDTVWLVDVPAVGESDEFSELRTLLSTRRIIGHNVTCFDLPWVWEHLQIRAGQIADTETAARLLVNGLQHKGAQTEEAKLQASWGLKYVLARTLGLELPKDQAKTDWGVDTLTPEQLAYAANDVRHLHRLLAVQQDALAEAGLALTWTLESRLAPIVVDMINRGFAFNPKGLGVVRENIQRRLDGVTKALLAWFDKPDLNLNSHPQLLAAFASRGVQLADTSEETLKADGSEGSRLLLEYRSLTHSELQFIDGLSAATRPDGRIHGTFDSLGARTGRFSCKEPNLQQVPKCVPGKFPLRSLFQAPTGKKLIVADFSQMELMAGAIVSNEPKMLDVLLAGGDLHARTASVQVGYPVTKKDNPRERDGGKPWNFGMFFGSSPSGIRRTAKTNYGIDLSKEQAEEFHAKFLAEYDSLAAWQNWTKDEAGNREVVEVRTRYINRRRFLPPLVRGQGGTWWERWTTLLNTPIQGSCAEVQKMGMLAIGREMADRVQIVCCIHDELVVETDARNAEQVLEEIQRIMRDRFKRVFGVECEVDAYVCDNWGEKGHQKVQTVSEVALCA
jgi:P4 family phage/plasmid primase-like protien